jgi:hypothetical protein
MLNNEANCPAIAWTDDLEGVRIQDKKMLEKDVLPNYFTKQLYESFLRHLKLYGFQRQVKLRTDSFEAVYVHPNFKKDQPEMMKFIVKEQDSQKEKRSERPRIKTSGNEAAAKKIVRPLVFNTCESGKPCEGVIPSIPLKIEEKEIQIENRVSLNSYESAVDFYTSYLTSLDFSNRMLECLDLTVNEFMAQTHRYDDDVNINQLICSKVKELDIDYFVDREMSDPSTHFQSSYSDDSDLIQYEDIKLS